MKNLFFPLIAWTLIIASCSRSNTPPPPDNGCIEESFIKLSTPGLPAAQMQAADSLFDASHIDHSNYRYYMYEPLILTPQDSPSTHHDQKVVDLDQYANGLRILNGQTIYTFWDGKLHTMYGHPAYSTNLDTIPSLSLTQLRAFFTRDLRTHSTSVNPGLTDSCYKAEFGYFDVSRNASSVNLVKAWLVTIKSAPYPFGYYPRAVYKDDNGQLIYFQGNTFAID
jgi:hypothetical protein